LDSAIKSKQLVVGFEPFIALRKLEACGAELHLAWRHPEYGPLAPGLFMPFVVAEGRTREITSFILREAARAAADWRRGGLDWKVSVNVPIEDLLDGTLPSALGVLLDEFNLPPEAITIDIAESDVVRFSAQALPAITGLRALGCGVALESAPGEAMIQDVRGLPFTEVKVSGAAIIQFVDRTRHSGAGRVAARVYNARSSGIPVTAVGIDNEAMLWSVQRLDFDAAQGPYICAPTDAFALLRWEKIWRQAAEAIRDRKNPPRRAAERPVEAVPPPPVIEDVPQAPIAAPLFEVEEVPAPQASFVAAEPAPAAMIAQIEAEFEILYPGELEPLAEQAEEPVRAEYAEAAAFDDDDELGSAEGSDFADEAALAQEPEPAPPPAYLQGEEVRHAAHGMTVHAPKAAPAAPAEPELTLVTRRLPGIDKPIVMTVQNEAAQRFGFLKRFVRKR
jgi:EAL domain-containing protein (putative c-di-GMP-specific phosphodiesterase class I)